MPRSISEQPLLKAKILALLMKFANGNKEVDISNENIQQLWDLSPHMEYYLFELSEQRAIYFEMIGEDGFTPFILCSINNETPIHLVNCLAEIDKDKNLLDTRIKSLLEHDPNRLKQDILDSELHIKQVQAQLATNTILSPLQKPLQEIEKHFESIRKVAENYDDIYKNILKPVQEEGKSGIRATVKWAIIGIVFSWLLSNYKVIYDIILTIRS